MVLNVIKYPNLILTQKSQKALFNKELETLVQNMLDTTNSFKDPVAAGLSAIQVGVPVRVLIARDFISNGEGIPQQLAERAVRSGTRDANAAEPVHYGPTVDYILVNPKIISLSKEKDLDWEGCLSFPDLYGKVWRAKKVKLKHQNIQGDEQRLTTGGFLARVIQHEMDHLDGITFNTKVVGKLLKSDEVDGVPQPSWSGSRISPPTPAKVCGTPATLRI